MSGMFVRQVYFSVILMSFTSAVCNQLHDSER